MSLCVICNQPCPEVTRRPRKYCSKLCKHIGLYGKPPAPKPTECDVCGTPIQYAGKGNPRRACSQKCRDIKHDAAKKARRAIKIKACIQCGKDFAPNSSKRICSNQCREQRKLERYEQEKLNRPAFLYRECGWCGQQIKVAYSAGPNKYHDDCKIQARRSRDRIKTVKRQGYRSNYLVTHEEIAKRDNYTCQICNEPVDMSLPRTSRFGATLDHIEPLSKGGSDTLENLQLAHWVCNNRKSDKVNYAESR